MLPYMPFMKIASTLVEAKASEAMFGTPAYHRDLLAVRLGLGA